MRKITIGTVVIRSDKHYAVVELLDCPASYEPHDKSPRLPAVVASPIRCGKVMGRTRIVLHADSYKLARRKAVDVPIYKIAKEDNEV